MRRIWTKKTAIVVIALAAPAFAFVTFDRLIKHAEQAAQSTLVETYRRTGMRVGESLRGVGQQLRAIDGALKPRAGEPPPAPPVADVTARPSELHVPVLVYHNIRAAKGDPAVRPYDVTPEEFDAQLGILEAEGFTPVTVSAAVDALSGASLPAKPVVITFDDGRADQYANAVPLLQKRGFVATFYVFTNAIDRPDYFTREQIATLLAQGHEIGSHAVYHPYLTKSDDAALKEELERSKATLEEMTGRPVRTFAYPFGLTDARVTAATGIAGYDSARGLDHSRVIRSGGELAIPGYIVTGSMSAFRGIIGAAAVDGR